MTIENPNFLSPLGFKFIVNKLPNVNYFCQSVTIPSVSIGSIPIAHGIATVPFPGSRLTFDPLTIRFKVDENLRNYIEILNWLRGLGHPNSLEETRQLSAQSPQFSRIGTAASYVSDATLAILSSHKNPTHMVNFKDVFPTQLSEITFTSSDSDVNYIDATVIFSYLNFDIEVLDN